MVRVNKEKAAKTAEFLFRYMVARYRCVGGSLSSGRIRLASEIRGGLQVFEGAIIVDADVQPPIINDHEYQDFLIAILKGGSAIPEIEPEELAEWRNYVLHSGAVPKWRQSAVTRGSTVPMEQYVSAGAHYSATALGRRSRSGRSSHRRFIDQVRLILSHTITAQPHASMSLCWRKPRTRSSSPKRARCTPT